MRAYSWVKQNGWYGLKQHSSPGYSIRHWIKRDKSGFWQIDGVNQDGVVWGTFPTLREAKQSVVTRLGLSGQVCSQCGSPIVQS